MTGAVHWRTGFSADLGVMEPLRIGSGATSHGAGFRVMLRCDVGTGVPNACVRVDLNDVCYRIASFRR